MHRSDRPVRMANNSATVTVRTWPSPCPAKARRLSRRYRSCKPGKVTVAGVRNRRRMRTNASLSFVLRSLAIRLTGIAGWRIPMVNGSRDGFACANTSSSRRLRVSPRKASCSKTMGKVAFSSIGFGQSVPGSKSLGTFGLPVQGHAKKAKTAQKHGPPQAPGAPWDGTLSTPRVPGQTKESGSTHRVTWEPKPFISTKNVQRKPYTPDGRGDGTHSFHPR